MTPEAQMAVSMTVVGIVQLIKFSKVFPERASVFIAAVASVIGMLVLIYSYPLSDRTGVVSLFALFYNIWSSASGAYGITSGKSETITASMTRSPTNSDV